MRLNQINVNIVKVFILIPILLSKVKLEKTAENIKESYFWNCDIKRNVYAITPFFQWKILMIIKFYALGECKQNKRTFKYHMTVFWAILDPLPHITVFWRYQPTTSSRMTFLTNPLQRWALAIYTTSYFRSSDNGSFITISWK